ncbi:hypothetical protein Scep_023874 [Stephania cephalantha]|uniref:Uncharacterized protein n=1 Tax=Stephania cephalantha TaxID=152367 RepID=A0AAP0EW01_9MAGN
MENSHEIAPLLPFSSQNGFDQCFIREEESGSVTRFEVVANSSGLTLPASNVLEEDDSIKEEVQRLKVPYLMVELGTPPCASKPATMSRHASIQAEKGTILKGVEGSSIRVAERVVMFGFRRKSKLQKPCCKLSSSAKDQEYLAECLEGFEGCESLVRVSCADCSILAGACSLGLRAILITYL